jgi:hypothetical protein
MHCFLLAVALLVPQSGAQAPRPVGGDVPVRLYIYTDRAQSGVATEDEQGRLDTVKDLREALRKNKLIALVMNRADATAIVEVVSREKNDAPIGGFGGTSVTPSGEVVIRLRVKFGDDETEIKGVAPGYWSRAAKDAADRFSRWLLRILQAREKRPRGV